MLIIAAAVAFNLSACTPPTDGEVTTTTVSGEETTTITDTMTVGTTTKPVVGVMPEKGTTTTGQKNKQTTISKTTTVSDRTTSNTTSVTTVTDIASTTAASLFTYTVENGEAIITGMTVPVKGVVNIPSTVGPSSLAVVAIGKRAFYDCVELTEVIFPETLTSIHEQAFSGCKKLKSVIIPSRVTSIGNSAFSLCDELTDVYFPESIKGIGGNAFGLCDKFANVYYAGTRADRDKIVISSWANQELQKATWHYAKVAAITTTTKPTKVTGAVYGPYTYNVDKGVATITGADPSVVKGAVIVPSEIDGYPVRHLAHYAYLRCNEITSITIPDSIVSFGESVFYSDYLTTVHIPAGVTSLDYRSFNGKNMTAYTVSPNNTAFVVRDGVLFNQNMTTLVAYPMGKAGSTYTVPDSVTTIGAGAFAGCQHLAEIHFGSAVKTVEYGAFWEAEKLTSVHFGTNARIAIASNAFTSCEHLTDVYYGGSSRDTVTIKTGSSTQDNMSILNATWHYNAK